MNRNQLCLLISVVQIGLAVLLWWYAPLQTLKTQEAVKSQYPNQHIQLGLDFYRRIEPAPAERVSFALNFPALVLSIPVASFFPEPLYESGFRHLSPIDFVFWGWIGVMWYWMTSRLFRREGGDKPKKMSRPFRVVWLVCGLLFALIVGTVGLTMLLSRLSTVPYKQIAPFGMLWSLLLAAYFIWKLRSEWKPTAS